MNKKRLGFKKLTDPFFANNKSLKVNSFGYTRCVNKQYQVVRVDSAKMLTRHISKSTIQFCEFATVASNPGKSELYKQEGPMNQSDQTAFQSPEMGFIWIYFVTRCTLYKFRSFSEEGVTKFSFNSSMDLQIFGNVVKNNQVY